MDSNEILLDIQQQLAVLKKIVIPSTSQTISEKWVSRSDVMGFLNYGSTQMAELEKSGDIVVTKIGKRKFILKESLEKLLNKNIIN